MTPNEDNDRPSAQHGTKPQDDFYRKVTLLLRAIGGRSGLGPEDAEDAAQEALLADILRQQSSCTFVSKEDEQRWLRAVQSHKIVDVQRHQDERNAQALDEVPQEPVDGATVRDQERMEARECVEVMLEKVRRQISPRDFRLLCQHHLEGRDYRSLAAETGLTVHAIRHRVNRAFLMLRRLAFGEEAAP